MTPVAKVVKIGNGTVTVICPYCDELHHHGTGPVKEGATKFGYRSPHCSNSGDYVMKVVN